MNSTFFTTCLLVGSMATPSITRPLNKEESKLQKFAMGTKVLWKHKAQAFEFYKSEKEFVVEIREYRTDVRPPSEYFYFKTGFWGSAPIAIHSNDIDTYKDWAFYKDKAFKRIFYCSLSQPDENEK